MSWDDQPQQIYRFETKYTITIRKEDWEYGWLGWYVFFISRTTVWYNLWNLNQYILRGLHEGFEMIDLHGDPFYAHVYDDIRFNTHVQLVRECKIFKRDKLVSAVVQGISDPRQFFIGVIEDYRKGLEYGYKW